MKWTVFRTTKPMVNRVQNSCWVKNKTYWINTCSQLVLLALKYRCDKNIAYPVGFEFKLKSRCVKSDLNWNPHVTRVNWNWNPHVTWVNWNWNPDVTKVCQHWCKVSVKSDLIKPDWCILWQECMNSYKSTTDKMQSWCLKVVKVIYNYNIASSFSRQTHINIWQTHINIFKQLPFTWITYHRSKHFSFSPYHQSTSRSNIKFTVADKPTEHTTFFGS